MGIQRIRKITYGALGRTSSALSLIILVAFVVMILSTGYHMLAFTPAEFVGRPETQEYENDVENITVMDEWTRTQYYWSNNLRVAGVSAIGTPIYLGLNTVIATNYLVGMSVTYYHHCYGPEVALAFSAHIFVHGLIELTGFYIIAAASLRVAWNLWKGLGHLMAVPYKGKKRLSLRLSKFEKREVLRYRGKIKQLLVDFIALFLIGISLIFLAAPIEAYVTPSFGTGFLAVPMSAVVFLVAVGLLYASIVAHGFNAMRRDVKSVWKNMGLAFRGKWRPVQFAFLIFVVLVLLMVFRLMF